MIVGHVVVADFTVLQRSTEREDLAVLVRSVRFQEIDAAVQSMCESEYCRRDRTAKC